MDDGDSGAVARERPAPGDTGAGERDELARAVRLIDGVLQAEGVSREEVDARLGRPRGTTAAVLAAIGNGGRAGGEAERQVREILAALELEPEIFFPALYAAAEPAHGEPDAEGAPLFERLAAELALAGYAPHPADDPVEDGAPPDPAELERRLREAIRAAGEGGGLDPDPPRGPARWPRQRRS
jgi:hypothetical protein